MKTQQLLNYERDRWIAGDGNLAEISSAIDGAPVAMTGSSGLDFGGMLRHAREVGGPALRKLTFHERARMIKALGQAIMARKEELYELNYLTGATRKDGWIDIEGGAGTLFSFSSKGRRELPDAHVLLDGQLEPLSKQGTFVGQHIYTSLQGAAVHINAFNFPVWGMLEKLAPTLLAGVPAIVKPASATAYLTEAAFKVMIEAQILPAGAIQLIVGGVGDLFDHLTGQDIVSFTGSASTALKLRTHPTVIRESVRFVAEQDSLNASLLGPDAAPGTPEFDLFIKEVATEMTVKAGQKCTAIRRAMAPAQYLDAVEQAIGERLAKTKVGDPRAEDTRMGALVSISQRDDVREKIAELEAAGARIVSGDPSAESGDRRRRIPVARPASHRRPVGHRRGPRLRAVRAGLDDHAVPRPHRRDRARQPRQGQPGPVAVHPLARCRARVRPGRRRLSWPDAGHRPHQRRRIDRSRLAAPGAGPRRPGRAGGSEEMGGVRGVKHYMQRTAIQSSPTMIAAITEQYIPGGPKHVIDVHPFRRKMSELTIGDTWKTGSRTVSIADIEHFAEFTGDKFYAHMDEEAAKASPIFEGRVAHGYLILSFAAGLFVDPDPGPVLANTGLENLRFLTPLYPGDSMRVELTVRSKSLKSEDTGVVRWAVEVFNQNDELVATYDLLTENVP